MLICLLFLGSCAYAAAVSASPTSFDRSPSRLSLRNGSFRSPVRRIQERDFETEHSCNETTRSNGAPGAPPGARLETLEPDDDAEVIPQHPQYPRYPQRPPYPQFPPRPQPPQYPQFPPWPQPPQYPQFPRWPYYLRNPWQFVAASGVLAPGVPLPGADVRAPWGLARRSDISNLSRALHTTG